MLLYLIQKPKIGKTSSIQTLSLLHNCFPHKILTQTINFPHLFCLTNLIRVILKSCYYWNVLRKLFTSHLYNIIYSCVLYFIDVSKQKENLTSTLATKLLQRWSPLTTFAMVIKNHRARRKKFIYYSKHIRWHNYFSVIISDWRYKIHHYTISLYNMLYFSTIETIMAIIKGFFYQIYIF